MERLRIVHCFRSPIGGLFRHVRDLVDGQIAEGHALGIVCDDNTGGDYEEAFFAALAPRLELGLHRSSMQRAVGPGDALALWRTFRTLARERPDVIHAHGAKGGAYARVIGTLLKRTGSRPARLYCPHGGSVHYDETTRSGRAYFALERALERMTDRLVFVSGYERDAYRRKVGEPRCPFDVVPNGLAPEEFEPVAAAPDAADFLYIGMMRDLKGVDLFLQALLDLPDATAHAVGDGPDLEAYKRRATALGLDDRLTFHDPMPAREAFRLARTVVVPSRAESMPYIVLETLAAARPLVATRVGGIPEIFVGHEDALVAPGDAGALREAMRAERDGTRVAPSPAAMREEVQRRFSQAAMVRSVMASYAAALGRA